MKRIQWLPLLAAFMLAGCNAAGVQPQTDPAPVAPVANAPADDKSLGKAMEQLEGRITALQEQVLNVRSQNARQLEQLQSLQVQLGMMGQTLRQPAPTDPSAPAPAESVNEEIGLLLDQVARMAGDLSLQVMDGNFRFASCYTQSGQWILIRYDRLSGESWLADKGVWMPLEESIDRPDSVYEISLQRADKDSKGFVAARLDRQTGQTWWLKQNTWHLLQQ